MIIIYSWLIALLVLDESVLVFAQSVTPSTGPEQVWKTKLPEVSVVTDALFSAADNTLFVGSTYGIAGTTVHHLSPDNGTTLYRFIVPINPNGNPIMVPTMHGPFSPRYLNDGKVDFLLLSIDDGNYRGRIVAYSPSKGELLWELPTTRQTTNDNRPSTGYAMEPPSISLNGTRAYICQSDGTISAIDTTMGAYLWQKTAPALRSMRGQTLSSDGESLFVSSWYDDVGQGALYHFKTSDGMLMQDFLLSRKGGPQIGPAFDSSRSMVFIQDATLGIAQFNPKSIHEGPVWSRNITQTSSHTTSHRPVFSSDGSKLYVPSGSSLACLDADDGMVSWLGEVGSFSARPVLSPDNQYLYTVNYAWGSHIVMKLRAVTGTVVWTMDLGSDFSDKVSGQFSLDATGARLYFGTMNGTIFSLSTDQSPKESPVPTVAPAVSSNETTTATNKQPTIAAQVTKASSSVVTRPSTMGLIALTIVGTVKSWY